MKIKHSMSQTGSPTERIYMILFPHSKMFDICDDPSVRHPIITYLAAQRDMAQ